MGMFLKIWALIMGMIMAFFSAKTPAKTYEPETVDINGVTYKNCFLHEGVQLQYSPDPLEQFCVDSKGEKWFSVSDKIKLRGESRSSVFYPDGILYYCREDEWNSIKNYYYNTDNWICSMESEYIKEDGTRKPEFKKEFESVNSEMWNKMMALYRADPANKHDGIKTIKLPCNIEVEKYRIRFEMNSKDGLFVAGSQTLLYYKGVFYFLETSVGGMYVEVNEISDDLQSFLHDLTKGYVE